MNVTVTVYQRRVGPQQFWTTLGLGPLNTTAKGHHEGKIREALVNQLRKRIGELKPSELERLELVRGRRLETAKLELSLRGEGRRRKAAMSVALVLEPRWLGEDERLTVAYHPDRQDDWFPVDESRDLGEQASGFYSQQWAELDDEALENLRLEGKTSLRPVSFGASPKTLLDTVKKKPRGVWDDLRDERRLAEEEARRAKRGGYKILPSLGVDLTRLAADGNLEAGVPRSPVREQLRALLDPKAPRPVALVGPSGVGKTAALHRWVLDLLDADGFASHRNPDRAHHVWRLSGKRIIAGMSYLGDWEQRCLEVLDDVRAKRCALAVDDLHLWGRIGRSRDSDRNLAEFFRGPVERRELMITGECSEAQWRQLEEDAPSFAALFTRLRLEPTSASETFGLMVHSLRRLEPLHRVRFSPQCLPTVYELASTLSPMRAFPGKALDLLESVARSNAGPRPDDSQWAEYARWETGEAREVHPFAVLQHLSERTGLSVELLRNDRAVDPKEIERSLERHVMGQPEAVRAAANLVSRVRAGMVDPKRPYGVFLFTGPTGTGKTELARALARTLYSDTQRLVRFDMGEFATGDAAARLVGDRWQPEGLLTRAATQQPFCVLLLDEIEKAHPQVLNLLLQLLDEGRLTDAAGNTASFTHAVVVMTSNLGARRRPPAGFGAEALPGDSDVLRAVREFFAPELFNRIDRVVSFRPLTPEVAREVAAKELGKLTRRRGLTDRNVFVRATPEAMDAIVDEAFRAADGARSLKRYLEDTVGSLLTEHLSGGRRAELQLVRVLRRDGRFAMEVEALRETETLGFNVTLERVADAPREELLLALAETRAWTEALRASPELDALSDAVREHLAGYRSGEPGHDEALFPIDVLRSELDALSASLASLSDAASKAEDWDLRGMEIEARDVLPAADPWSVERRRWSFQRRAMLPLAGAPVRAEIVRALAEAHALRRAVARVNDPSQHAVWIHVARATPPEFRANNAGEGFFEAMVLALAKARGEVTRAAFSVSGTGEANARTHTPRNADAWIDEASGCSQCCFEVVGLCVKDFYELETGSHLWYALAGPPEITRVEVLPARRDSSPEQFLLATFGGGDTGRPFSADPVLPALPLLRSIRFDPPAVAGTPSPMVVEDFALGMVRSGLARHTTDLLPELWTLRMSRED